MFCRVFDQIYLYIFISVFIYFVLSQFIALITETYTEVLKMKEEVREFIKFILLIESYWWPVKEFSC